MGKSRDLFKKNGDLKVTFHAKVGVIKDKNGRDLTEEDQIKKRWQEYTEDLNRKDLNTNDDLNSWSYEMEPEILESEWPKDWKRSVYIPIPKNGNAKECSNYRTIALISHASKVMFKILQARLKQYMDRELSDVQAGFCRGRGTRDQIANVRWKLEKAREFQKNIYFSLIDYSKAFDSVDHNNMWQVLKEMGVPDHLIRLLRNLYVDQEATVRTEHGTTEWFKIGKGVRQGCILSPYLFNLYAKYIIHKAGLDKSKAGINFAGRNIKNLRYADDTTLMAESEEELKDLLFRVKGESAKAGLLLNVKKTKIMVNISLSSWQIDGEEVEAVTDFIFLGSKISSDGDCSHEIKTFASGKGKLWQALTSW
ncbi:Hypothetical predicted protein [Pelobates cultripes]|uniref:Reverse transcriptase domain-containing protein n=1 Tax=Pelobates cultripes TaxID=61616 RepID=A0AAD1S8L3_PELCU|nr:Hypothetical predicted protein [Pelobates cultripes]